MSRGPGSVSCMDLEVFARAMGKSLPTARYAALKPSFEAAMRAAGVTTPARAAMFVAQIGHETGGLLWLEELASGRAYEGRADLGNTRPGDGPRFKGRGAIMVTGRANYANLSAWAHGRGLVPTRTYFVDRPGELSSDRYYMTGAIWYWTVARPQLNSLSDARDLEGATRAINGGLNGLADRRERYSVACSLEDRLIAGATTKEENVSQKVLPYSRAWVGQDTYYNCGPASVQTIVLSKTGRLVGEQELGRALGTHTGGTDHVGLFPAVLNKYAPGGNYKSAVMPNDPPTRDQRETLWKRLVTSINGGYGVVANIVAPPSNYPRAVEPSTISPAYRGGTVYHYVAVMGYAGSGSARRVWVADSGFYPYGYWMSFSQLATLIPPKGYVYATPPKPQPKPVPKPTIKEENMNDIDRTRLRLALEQLAGPGKDKKGLPVWEGWDVKATAAAGKRRIARTGKCTPVEALFVIGEEILAQYLEEEKK